MALECYHTDYDEQQGHILPRVLEAFTQKKECRQRLKYECRP